jgi:hypothetical protein
MATAVVIQSTFRRSIVRNKLGESRAAAVKIQSAYRRNVPYHDLCERVNRVVVLESEVAATLVQDVHRRNATRQLFLAHHAVTTALQAAARSLAVQQQLGRDKVAAASIQACWSELEPRGSDISTFCRQWCKFGERSGWRRVVTELHNANKPSPFKQQTAGGWGRERQTNRYGPNGLPQSAPSVAHARAVRAVRGALGIHRTTVQ